jgi:hypothetical protein
MIQMNEALKSKIMNAKDKHISNKTWLGKTIEILIKWEKMSGKFSNSVNVSNLESKS